MGHQDPVNQRDVELHILHHKLERAEKEQREKIEAQILAIKKQRSDWDELFQFIGMKLVGHNYILIRHYTITNPYSNELKLHQSAGWDPCDVNGTVTHNFRCLRNSIVGIQKNCGTFDHYAFSYTRQLV